MFFNVSSAAPGCQLEPPSDDVELVSPQGEVSVTRGSIVRYACRDEYVLTEGQLVLACGHDGHFIGQLPVCTGKRETINNVLATSQRSNDPRGKLSAIRCNPLTKAAISLCAVWLIKLNKCGVSLYGSDLSFFLFLRYSRTHLSVWLQAHLPFLPCLPVRLLFLCLSLRVSLFLPLFVLLSLSLLSLPSLAVCLSISLFHLCVSA